MIPRKLFALTALAGLLTVGCTSENSPLTPDSTEDTTPPAAPQGAVLRAESAGWAIKWEPNGEADLAGYNVFVYDPDPSRENAYVKVNTSIVTSTSYAVPVDPGVSVYRVRALDVSGNQSGMSAIAGIAPAGGGGSGGDEIIRRTP